MAAILATTATEISTAEEVVLADWRRQAITVGLVGFAAAGLALFLAFLVRQMARREASEAVLRQSEERYRDFTAAASDWDWEQDADLRFTYAGSSDHSAIRPSDVLGRTRREIVSMGVTEEQWRQHDADLAARRPLRDFRFQRLDPSGGVRHISVSGNPRFGADGRFLGYRGVARDIKREVEAAEREATAHRRLRDVFESAGHGQALFDADDRLVLCNKRCADMFPELASLLLPSVRFETCVREAARRGGYHQGVGDLESWVDKRLALHRNLPSSHEQGLADGRSLLVGEHRTAEGGTLVSWTDITAMELREREFQAAREAAQIANRTKSEFLANMNHELRTPLNAIIGFSELLAYRIAGKLSDVQRQYVEDIRTSGHHLLAIINDVLDMSTVEAGKLTLREEAVDIAGAVRTCMRLVAPRLDETAVRLDAVLPADLPRLHADAVRVKQIVLNLLSNAVKFSPGSGRVRVAAAQREDGSLAISIADTGIGMTEAEIALALQPFRQVDNSLSRKYEGTGLGLPLAKSLVELHDGRLEIASVPGAGTTVSAVFPPGRVIDPAVAGGLARAVIRAGA
ncbi:MAG: ATP-binding protein [Pseudomonadota bacterium]